MTETDSELIFERSEELYPNSSGASNQKQVTATYANEEVLNMPVVRRASDRELLSMSDDLQLSNPVQVDIAETVAVNSSTLQKYSSFIQCFE